MRNPLILRLKRSYGLGEEDCAKLSSLAIEQQHLAQRKDIFREGDRPSNAIVVMEGIACRYKWMGDGKRAITAYLLPGDFCDPHLGAFRRMDHNVATLTACTIAEIPRATIEVFIKNNPSLARALWQASLIEGTILRTWLANMGQLSADRQLAHLLCELRVRLEVVGMGEKNTFRLPLTQQELGDALGITTIHVNRVLQRLRENDLIRVIERTVFVPDIARLEAFADFNPGYLHISVENTDQKGEARGHQEENGLFLLDA